MSPVRPVGDRFRASGERRAGERPGAAERERQPGRRERSRRRPDRRGPRRRAAPHRPGRGRGAARRRRWRRAARWCREAEFTSYYGRPIVKPPVWTARHRRRTSSPAGWPPGRRCWPPAADLTGRPALRRGPAGSPRWARSAASAYFLVHDLGRPARFHNMLRVAKPTSPMSVGTWILAALRAGRRARRRRRAAPLLPERGCPGWSAGCCRRPGGRRAGRGRRRAGAGHVHRRAARRHGRAVLARGVPGAAVRLRGQRAGQRRRCGADRRARRAGRAGPPAGGGRRGAGAVRRRTGWRPGWACSASPTARARPGRLLRAGRALTAAGRGRCAARPAQPGGLRAVRHGAAGRLGVHPVRRLPRRGGLGPGPEIHGAAAAGADPSPRVRAGLTPHRVAGTALWLTRGRRRSGGWWPSRSSKPV